MQSKKDFCFCTLALGEKYINLIKDLAKDLEKHSPGTFLVVYTDKPKLLRNCPNVKAYRHYREGVDYCYNDKRFAIKKSLEVFPAVIFVDADTRITGTVPEIDWQPGITCQWFMKILEHPPNITTPGRQEAIKKLGLKLGLDLDKVSFVCENLFVVVRDGGREKEFIKYWGKIGRYFEVNKVKSKDGNPIGLAAAKVGWTYRTARLDEVDKVRDHFFAHWKDDSKKRTFWDRVLTKVKWEKIKHEYRWRKAQLLALLDFNFYYR